MKVKPKDWETLLNIARVAGYDVKAGHIPLKEGCAVIRGSIIMFMMAFDLPVEACDDVANVVLDEFSYTIEKQEDDE